MYYPLVSIITPSYNQGKFLEQCIQSVLSQDYPNIEYIIIDGGSTDNSIDIIRKYEDSITYWCSEPDRGQSHAINKGFNRAKGEIVAWLNSDDLYFQDAVSSAVKCFYENKNLSLFYGDCVYVDEKGGFIRYFTEVESYNQHRLLNYSDYIMQPTTFFRRKELLKVGLLDENCHYTMDWDLWCKLSKIGDVFYEKKLIAANRDYEDTKTNTGGIKRLVEIWRHFKRHGSTIWPNSFICYSSAEIRNKTLKHNKIIVRKIGVSVALFINCLSPSAIIYSFRNKQENNLYGFEPYKLLIPKGEAMIKIPFLNKFSRITIEFKLCGSSIFVNNNEVKGNIAELELENDISTTGIDIRSYQNDKIEIEEINFYLL